MNVCLCFGGPSDERNISAGSIKPWVTWLAGEPSVDLSIVFFDREVRAWRLPRVYRYTNTCEDFESQLREEDALEESALRELLAAQDVVVPLIHGRFGEDGELQRLLEALGVAYVFSGPEALARTMDKAATYRALAAAGMEAPRHRVLGAAELVGDRDALHRELLEELAPASGRFALAVKPLRGGSSFGVSLVGRSRAELDAALGLALEQDATAALVEEVLEGVEFSVVVLEREGRAVPLVPTEVAKRTDGPYDTRSKYLHGEGAVLHTPLRAAESIEAVRAAAREAFLVLGLRDMARVDGFLGSDGRVWVTDVNGIPGMGFSSFGFLQTSLAGISHAELIEILIGRALERVGRERLHLASAKGDRGRVTVLLGGPTSERQVSRQSGIFVGLCLQAAGYDTSFVLFDISCRFTPIGLFYALHHDVEEIAACIAAPAEQRQARALARRVAAELGLPPERADRHTFVGATTELAPAVRGADFVFLALHGGPGEDGTLQTALEALGLAYNGSGPEASALCADKVASLARVAAAGLQGVAVPRQREVTTLELLEHRRRGDFAELFAELSRELGSRRIVGKPAADGCSTGAKPPESGDELAAFAGAILAMTPFLPAGAFGRGSRPLKMPEPPPRRWIFEQALVDDDEPPLPRGDLNARNLAAWLARKRFLEITGSVVEDEHGRMLAATPSLTVATRGELSLEEKFQQGVGTNLELDCLIEPRTVDSIRRRVEAIAAALGLAGYARIDCFWDRRADLLYLLEANTLCGLTEATVFYSQALRAFDASPPEILERIVETGLRRPEETAAGTLVPSRGRAFERPTPSPPDGARSLPSRSGSAR